MLKIILGDRDASKWLTDRNFVNYNDGLFNDEWQEAWFEDPFVQKVLSEVDHIDLTKSSGSAMRNSITGDTHSPRELSTGCKTLILIYKFPGVVFQARMGDNCTDLLEEIVANMTRDVVLKSDYLHPFSFRILREIEYVNYGFVARSTEDLLQLLSKFHDDNVVDFGEPEDILGESDEEFAARHPDFVADLAETRKKYYG